MKGKQLLHCFFVFSNTKTHVINTFLSESLTTETVQSRETEEVLAEVELICSEQGRNAMKLLQD